MSEQQTPEEIADGICRWTNDGLRDRVVEAIRSAILAEREACAKREQDALQEIYNEAAFVVTGAPWNLFAQWVVDKVNAIRARAEAQKGEG